MTTFLRDVVESGTEIEATMDIIDGKSQLALVSSDELNKTLRDRLSEEICDVLNRRYPVKKLRKECFHHHFSFMKCQCGEADCDTVILVHTEVGDL
jgi:hypothetical protein